MEKRLHEKNPPGGLRSDSALADFPGGLQELAQRLDSGEFALSAPVPAVPEPQAGALEPGGAAFRRLRYGRLLKNSGLQVQNLARAAGRPDSANGVQQQRRNERGAGRPSWPA